MARREYTAGRATTLSSAFAIGASTFTIADDGSSSTWPTGADFDFFVTIGAGTSNEERVLCSERNGRVITIAAGGRNKDATGEKNHAAGETAWPSLSAQDVDEANAHVNSTGYASYSQTVHGLGSGDGVVVGTTKEQTLTLKTLTSPKINENVALTATSTELNILDGATLSTAELNYVDGVTSAIQTQLNTIVNTTIPAVIPVATIIMYGGTSAPTGWLLCDGQSTTGYAALAAVVGANVPDLRGRAPIGYGQGAGLTNRSTIGATTGTETHTLTAAQIPGHTHSVTIMGSDLSYGTAALQGSAGGTQQTINAGEGGGSNPAGGGAHPNMQPSTVVNFIIKT
jgi:microcystin-dependent protein